MPHPTTLLSSRPVFWLRLPAYPSPSPACLLAFLAFERRTRVICPGRGWPLAPAAEVSRGRLPSSIWPSAGAGKRDYPEGWPGGTTTVFGFA